VAVRRPSPLIQPDVRSSRIRRSDWLPGRLTTLRPIGGTGVISTHPCAEDRRHAEQSAASRRHLVAPGEKLAHAVIEMRLDHPVRGIVRTRTEVAAPPRHRRAARTDGIVPDVAEMPSAHAGMPILHSDGG